MVKKILVVDDEKDISDSVKMLLETMGHEAQTTDDGNVAINLLKEEKFDLVLLDILMPKISGIKTLEKIRADPKLKNQKVAFLTVVDLSKSGRGKIGELKPIAYIGKPIDNVDFKNKMKKILK